jgi:hypothetical protein
MGFPRFAVEYLLDADVMLSADRILVSIAEKWRPDAPFTIAKSSAVLGAGEAVPSVLEALKA